MQRLYYFPNDKRNSRPEFCIFPTESSRNYHCYTFEDPALFRASSLSPILRQGEICILEAPIITLDLIRQQLPEFFI